MSNPNYEQYIKNSRSIGNVIDLERELSRAVNVDQYYNTPFRIHSIQERTGREGKYIIMSATNLLNNEEINLSTGGVGIVNVMQKIDTAKEFPVDCAFCTASNSNFKLIREIIPQDFE